MGLIQTSRAGRKNGEVAEAVPGEEKYISGIFDRMEVKGRPGRRRLL